MSLHGRGLGKIIDGFVKQEIFFNQRESVVMM